MTPNAYDFQVQDAKGQTTSLHQYQGQVTLIVNVASRCGFTPQYAGLEKLQQKLGPKGFHVLAFPCNQFGSQEPGSNEEIQSFCQIQYGVKFPVFGKIEVNGSNTDPLFVYLKSAAPGLLGTEAIKWNFTKFLVGRNGQVLSRFAPQTKPEDLLADIEKALVC